jgi:hypothetical protein
MELQLGSSEYKIFSDAFKNLLEDVGLNGKIIIFAVLF